MYIVIWLHVFPYILYICLLFNDALNTETIQRRQYKAKMSPALISLDTAPQHISALLELGARWRGEERSALHPKGGGQSLWNSWNKSLDGPVTGTGANENMFYRLRESNRGRPAHRNATASMIWD
jgi:hypothetical protein